MPPYLTVCAGRLLGSQNQHAHWKWREREWDLAALKANFTKQPTRRNYVLSSLLLTLCGCWLLLLKGLKLCMLLPPSSTFFKTIHLTWTASQRISFVLESFPEQQPHYEGVFKQMPPASASVSDNKTFPSLKYGWVVVIYYRRLAPFAIFTALCNITNCKQVGVTSSTLKSSDIVGGTGQQCICWDLGTVSTSEHFGPFKTIGNSPKGEHTRFNCLMWLWIRYQLYLVKIVLLHLSGAVFPVDLQGCSACPLQARAVRWGSSLLQAGNWEVKSWRKKRLRTYPLFGLADVGFFQDRTNASGLRVKNEKLETPSGANRILSYGQEL